MGHTQAIEMKEAVDEGQINLDEALTYHLRCNHYPPVPTSMIEPCKKAIELANNGEYDELVQLPEGVTWRGEDVAPVWSIVEAHHLQAFLDESE